jgi:hypothetical protein
MSENRDDKKYMNDISFKEMNFDDGNSIIAVDIKVDDFINALKQVPTNDAGYAKFRIVRRKTPSDWGHTHFMSIYAPKEKEEGNSKPNKNPDTFIEGGDDDMPF